jgi:hypothetical protein
MLSPLDRFRDRAACAGCDVMNIIRKFVELKVQVEQASVRMDRCVGHEGADILQQGERSLFEITDAV